MTRKVITTSKVRFLLCIGLLISLPYCGTISDVGSVSVTALASPTPTPVGWTGVIQKGLASKSTTGYGVALDSLANVYLVGNTSGNLVAGSGSPTGFQDLYIMKYNSAGVQQWVRQVGATSKTTDGQGVAVDSAGNPYVVGYSNGNLSAGSGSATGTYDVVLIKFDTSGVQQWIQQIGVAGYSTQNRTNSIAIDSSNNIYVGGYTTGNLVSGSGAATGSNDYFIAKYNSSGAQQWIKQVGVATYATLTYGVRIDSSGNVYVAGYTNANLVAGAGAATGNFDIFIAKYTASGTREWVVQKGVAGYQNSLRGVTVDSSGNIYATGQTGGNLVTGVGVSPSGGTEYFLMKYDSSGTLRWVTQLGVGATTNIGWAAQADSSGNVYITGQAAGNLVTGSGASTGSPAPDYFLIKFDSSGNRLWAKQVGIASVSSIGYGLAADSYGNIILIGNTAGNLVTGSGAATGSSDLFAAEYTSDGTRK